MYCGFCGRVITDDAVFCPYCGKPVKPIAPSEPSPALQQVSEPIAQEQPAPVPVAETPEKTAEASVPDAQEKPSAVSAPAVPEEAPDTETSSPEPAVESQKSPEQTSEPIDESPAVPVVEESLPAVPVVPSAKGRSNKVHDFVSIPKEWENPAPDFGKKEPEQAPVREQAAALANEVKEKTVQYSAAVKEKAAEYGAIAKEKAAQYGAVAKEKAAEYGAIAKEKATQYGAVAKEKAVEYGAVVKDKAVKLGAAAGEKAKDVMERLQAMPAGKMEKKATTVVSVVSKLSLVLILAAVFLPYCRIAFSDSRYADMPLWKLIFGGTYEMGLSNPLQFTLIAHPVLLLLLLIPLLVLLTGIFKKSKVRLPLTSGILLLDGLAVLIANGRILRSVQRAVSGLSLDTFEKHVKSMNALVIKWIQRVVTGELSFENTFLVTGQIGHTLITLFGWLMLLLGIIGIILCLIKFSRSKGTAAEKDGASEPVEETL